MKKLEWVWMILSIFALFVYFDLQDSGSVIEWKTYLARIITLIIFVISIIGFAITVIVHRSKEKNNLFKPLAAIIIFLAALALIAYIFHWSLIH